MRLLAPLLALALPGCVALLPLAVPLAEVAVKGAVQAYQAHELLVAAKPAPVPPGAAPVVAPVVLVPAPPAAS